MMATIARGARGAVGSAVAKGWATLAARSIASSAASSSGEVERLMCETRSEGGSSASRRVRREGRVPALIFAPGEERGRMISVCEREMNATVRRLTLAGTQRSLFDLEVREETSDGSEAPVKVVRALAKQVQMHAYNQKVDNVCFLEVEPETQVRVHVPVRTQGDDVSPGVKRGGFVQILRNTVPVRCRSDSIPKNFMMDVSALDVGKIIKIRDVAVPEGVTLLDSDLDLPMIKISGKVKSAA